MVKDHAQWWGLISAVKKAWILLLIVGYEGQGIRKAGNEEIIKCECDTMWKVILIIILWHLW